jgi:hypothetical protein
MKKAFLLTALLLSAAVLAAPHVAAAAETSATGGAGGIYPPGTSFNGVPINGIQLGFGVEIGETGSALGQFAAILLGVSALGLEQNIKIEGAATSGSRNAANVAIFSGTANLDMGDGTPPAPVPFSVTVTTDANSRGSVGLVLGLTTLPNASVNAGSMTIE